MDEGNEQFSLFGLVASVLPCLLFVSVYSTMDGAAAALGWYPSLYIVPVLVSFVIVLFAGVAAIERNWRFYLTIVGAAGLLGLAIGLSLGKIASELPTEAVVTLM